MTFCKHYQLSLLCHGVNRDTDNWLRHSDGKINVAANFTITQNFLPIIQSYRYVLISTKDPPDPAPSLPTGWARLSVWDWWWPRHLWWMMISPECLLYHFLIIQASETFFPPSSFTASFCLSDSAGRRGKGARQVWHFWLLNAGKKDVYFIVANVDDRQAGQSLSNFD